ncbi:MAG: 5-(carboxyamino)imidazole ribonucleotide mutase [Calditrichaceae bacterium]|nr:5-(carboxyamino)imidazole ribonucleotide mutase [Calditrichia bacterium]NUQ40895.1 5-(carboxyamino)imidazole ribonucleotide mutase [Calditrichaceae bacterium]
MKKVAIILGSESDRETVNASLDYYEYFGIPLDIRVMSAHRNPEQVQQFAKTAAEEGYGVIVACAGMAAHLPGVIAAYTTLPVIGVPLAGSELNGVDALYSIVQMPAGVPVATVAIGKAGARNAAVLAAQILALSDKSLAGKLGEFKKQGCKL